MKKCMLYLLPVVALFGLVSCGGGVESDMLSLYSWRISKYNSFVSDMNDAKTIDEIGAVIDERKKIEDEFKRRREELIGKAIDKEKGTSESYFTSDEFEKKERTLLREQTSAEKRYSEALRDAMTRAKNN